MENQLLHTPEGVRDIYSQECSRKLYLQDGLHKVFHQYGFRDIQTPTFEFFDVFSKEVGTIPSKDLYKFFDREGSTLVLRPDYTPSIARCAAKYYPDEQLPLRFCYCGNVFINETAVYQGRLKETTQMGAEMIGDTSVQADSEMISLVIHLLRKAGLENFQVEIGQVEFFKGLLEEGSIREEIAVQLREQISQKNYFGVEEVLAHQNISSGLKELFMKLPELFGSVEVITKARELTNNPRSLAALDRLMEIYEILKMSGLETYVSFDLGMLSKYMYYTGIIFKSYTMGTGEALVKGGRYDNLLGLFGKNSPAIGFTLMADTLILALSRQKIHIPSETKNYIYLYKKEFIKEALLSAAPKREQGERIALICMDETKSLKDYLAYAGNQQIDVLYFFDSSKEVRCFDMKTEEEHTEKLSILPEGSRERN
ncbi:MAG: ATP phosphoribosyltransferase regulatory subunit [Lachnospiraceae bacterium]|nr:ATP phosphoribosyltransferase regulatory subunit [Lachnospiraceae bacterium]